MENCNNYQERISAFLDGLLTEKERLELMEHMASCPACQQYFNDQITIHEALTSLEADAPEGFTEAVMARVRATKQDTPAKKAAALPHWRRWAAAAACCAVAVLGVMGLGGNSNELGPTVSQNTASYDLSRSEEASVAADTSAAADDKPVTYTSQTSEPASTEGVAPCSATENDLNTATTASSPPLEDAARTEADAESKEKAESAVLTTASPLAEQWVEDHLGQTWQADGSYTLTAAQFDALRGLLDAAGELYTVEAAENSGFLLLAAA